jgi:hypothetical protein
LIVATTNETIKVKNLNYNDSIIRVKNSFFKPLYTIENYNDLFGSAIDFWDTFNQKTVLVDSIKHFRPENVSEQHKVVILNQDYSKLFKTYFSTIKKIKYDKLLFINTLTNSIYLEANSGNFYLDPKVDSLMFDHNMTSAEILIKEPIGGAYIIFVKLQNKWQLVAVKYYEHTF